MTEPTDRRCLRGIRLRVHARRRNASGAACCSYSGWRTDSRVVELRDNDDRVGKVSMGCSSYTPVSSFMRAAATQTYTSVSFGVNFSSIYVRKKLTPPSFFLERVFSLFFSLRGKVTKCYKNPAAAARSQMRTRNTSIFTKLKRMMEQLCINFSHPTCSLIFA